jgi:hypothetical protein
MPNTSTEASAAAPIDLIMTSPNPSGVI